LPAAGFDDCEHRFIPSCSIPASEQVRAGFLFSRYGYEFCAKRERVLQIHAKTSGARNPPRRLAGLIAAGSRESRKRRAKTGQIWGIWAEKARIANGEERLEGQFATRHSLLAL
jgi:hypothetical protein